MSEETKVVPITRVPKPLNGGKQNIEHHLHQMFQKLEVHELEPGDLLVLTLADRLPLIDKRRINQGLIALSRHMEARVVVLDPGDRLEVVRRFMNEEERKHFLSAFQELRKQAEDTQKVRAETETADLKTVEAEIARLQEVAARKRQAAAAAEETQEVAPPDEAS